MRRALRVVCAVTCVASLGCGSDSSTGPAALPDSVPVIAFQITPNPLQPAWVSATDSAITVRMVVGITLTESAGAGGQIDQVMTTVTSVKTLNGFTSSIAISGRGMSTSMMLRPRGTVSFSHSSEFAVSNDAQTTTWEITVSGTDAGGRPFAASSAPLPVQRPSPGS